MPNTLLATDNFASGSLAAGWSALPTFLKCQVVVGTPNVAEANTASTIAGQQWTGLTWPNDQVSEAKLQAYVVGGSPQLNLVVRGQTGSFTCYNAIIFSGKWQINKTINGSGTKIIAGYATTSPGDTWALWVQGSQLSLYQNGVLVGTAVDVTLASGNPGFYLFASTITNVTVSLWNGYSIPSPAVGTTTPFSQIIVRDTFTRANVGTLGANWTALSDALDTAVLGITNNAAEVQTFTGGRAASFWNANTFQANQYSQVYASGSATGTNSHRDGVIVRGTASGYYGFTWDLTGTATTNFQLFKVVSGVLTDLGGAALQGPTPVLGSLLRLEIVGTNLLAYCDGTLIFDVTDSSISSGAPGVTGSMAASTPTAFMTNWEGGSLLWTRQGTVIPIGTGGGTQEVSVVYEANPQILSANADGKIWKMWHTNGWSATAHINYQESPDAIHWTPYASNPVISDGTNNTEHGFVLHNGNTYYAFEGNDLGAGNSISTQIDLWESTNGVTFSLTQRSVIAVGGVGAWDHNEIANPLVWVEGGTWFMLYTASSGGAFSVGLATSPDGVTWTKYAGNPVITDSNTVANGKTILKDGGIYYLFGFGHPSVTGLADLKAWSSPNLHTWTGVSKNPYYIRVLVDEGANASGGQVADPCLVELNGTSYMFHDGIITQVAGQIHVNLTTAPFTLLQLKGIIFGTNIIAGNVGVAGATVSYSGTASGFATADANGNYVIPIQANGPYTITPSLAGNSFSPVSSAQTISGADITGVNFTANAGANVYSIPDCRNFSIFPNASRTVNVTKIYDVQTSDNSAVPGTDSRSVKTIASGTYPQNSRTPGTFGPGE